MATKLTEQEKMILWHEGKRSLNIKACSTDKLKRYIKICQDLGYDDEVDELHLELWPRLFGDKFDGSRIN